MNLAVVLLWIMFMQIAIAIFIGTVQLPHEVGSMLYLFGKFIPWLLTTGAHFISSILYQAKISIQHPQSGIKNVYLQRVFTEFTFPWNIGKRRFPGTPQLRKGLKFCSKMGQTNSEQKVEMCSYFACVCIYMCAHMQTHMQTNISYVQWAPASYNVQIEGTGDAELAVTGKAYTRHWRIRRELTVW